MSFHIEIPLPPAWMKDALCAQVGGDAWYPEDGERGTTVKALCGTCPVRDDCLEYAITHDERYGIWGGLAAWERRPIVLAREAA
jgi:WhiB family redox-sensing transcriptional regulator